MISPALATSFAHSSVQQSIDDICDQIVNEEEEEEIIRDFVPVATDGDFLSLNIGGHRFKLSNSAAARLPTPSLLHRLAFGESSRNSSSRAYCLLPDTQEYFFDRSPHLFEFVLGYCYTGRLHCPESEIVGVLQNEFHFWGLDDVTIEKCCKPATGDFEGEGRKRAIEVATIETGNKPGESGLRRIVSLRRNKMTADRFHCRVTRPCCAKIFTSLSIVFLCLSILNLILSTEPSFKSSKCWFSDPPIDPTAGLDPAILDKLDRLRHLISNSSLDDDGVWFFNATDIWFESFRNLRRFLPAERKDTAGPGAKKQKGQKISPDVFRSNGNCTERHRKSLQTSCINSDFIFDVIETVCMAWFTFEYLVRFVAAHCRLRFLKDGLNIIDMLATIPFYIEIGLDSVTFVCYQFDKVDSFLAALKVLRVFRIVKLARYFRSLRVFGLTLAGSKRELVTITMFTSVTIVIFSSMIYYAEKDDPNTLYVSIPTSFYWCIVTITTVGYGDMHPRTIGGKIIGAVACVSGILILAFPVSILTERFMKTYKNESPAPSNVKMTVAITPALRDYAESGTPDTTVPIGRYLNHGIARSGAGHLNDSESTASCRLRIMNEEAAGSMSEAISYDDRL